MHKLVSLKSISIGQVEDHLRLLYPYKTFDAEHLKSLSIPFWNPYTLSGFPYLASLRCEIFYPINLIFLILPAHLAMNFSIILHLFLAGSFMYLLAKGLGMDQFGAIVSALAFMFSGYFIDEIWWGHETRLASITWTPLVFLLFLIAIKKEKFLYAILSGFVFAIQIFSGHLQFPYYGMLALFFFAAYLFVAFWKDGKGQKALLPLFYFLVVVVVGLALASVQIIPAAELTRHSIRNPSGEAFSLFTRWSMHPSYVITFIFPRLTSIIGKISYPFPISLGYIGILSILFVVLSVFMMRKKNVLFFWILLIISLLFALGRYTPIYVLFYKFFPGFSAFRNPVLFIYLYVFSASILSGFGVSFLKERIWNLDDKKRKIIVRFFAAGCILFLLISLAVFLATSRDSISQPDMMGSIQDKMQKYRNTLIYDFGTIGSLVLLAMIPLVFRKKIQSRDAILKVTFVSLIFLDLMLYETKYLQTYNLTPFVSKEKYVDFLKKEGEPFRVLPILDYPEQDAVLKLNKISSINGYGSLEIMQDYEDFIAAFQTEPVTQEATILRVANHDSMAVNLLNTKYILTYKRIEDDRFPLVYTDEISAAQTWDPHRKDKLKIYIYENKSVLPRAFVVPSFKIIKDRKQILAAIKDPKFEPRNVIILEVEPEDHLNNRSLETGTDYVSFESYKENELILKASLTSGGYLFLSEIYYPGWKAFVNGKQKRIYRANYLFRSIYLDKGVSTVKFVYKPLSIKIGALITLTTLGILLVLLFEKVWRKRTQN